MSELNDDDDDDSKGVASMRQDEAIASSCFRRRQIFAHLFHDKANVNFNIQVATENTMNFDVFRRRSGLA